MDCLEKRKSLVNPKLPSISWLFLYIQKKYTYFYHDFSWLLSIFLEELWIFSYFCTIYKYAISTLYSKNEKKQKNTEKFL